MTTLRDWKEKLIDEFCVMFERAHREDGSVESGDYWAEKTENFIESLLSLYTEELKKELEEYPNPYSSANRPVGLAGHLEQTYEIARKDVLSLIQSSTKELEINKA